MKYVSFSLVHKFKINLSLGFMEELKSSVNALQRTNAMCFFKRKINMEWDDGEFLITVVRAAVHWSFVLSQ